MENEMLNKILEEVKSVKTEMTEKILEEVKSVRTEMNEKFEKVDKRFEEMDKKFEGKFEGIKIELKQLRKDFERHDRGEKMAWEDFEKSIGKEFEELRKIVEKNGAKVDIIGNGLGKIYEEYKIAEEQEEYKHSSTK